MNRITKEYYHRLRPLLLPRRIPSFVNGDITKVFSVIKYECRQLATRWTVLSAIGRDFYFKSDYSYLHSHLDMAIQQVHTGRVVLVDGTPIPEVVIKEVTGFRMIIDYRFRQQAERRIAKIYAKTEKLLQMEVYGFTPDNKVYFIEDSHSGHIKIGVSHNPEQRRQTLASQRGTSLTLLGTIDGGYKKEKALHRRFAHLRDVGEWFHACPELRQELQAMLQ